MTEKILQSLGGVSETLLMTLYVRASETRLPDAMIRDERAVAMVDRLECDFSRLRMKRHDEVALILRMKKFDSQARDFLWRNPEAVVVHIGRGLDTRFERVDTGLVEWVVLDLPAVMALRQRLLPGESSRYHALVASVFEAGWLAEVDRFGPRPALFIAEGVLPYFEKAQVKALFLQLRDHYLAVSWFAMPTRRS